ncbi:MAG: serine/threonine protein kinase [bacterium]
MVTQSTDLETRALAIFEQALNWPAEIREQKLLERCDHDPALLARVRQLLTADSATQGFGTNSTLVMSNSPPEHIGPYRLTNMIGRGGMGVVYGAQRISGGFSQSVAIKLFNHTGDPATAEAFANRFRSEQEILAALRHPNIAQLFDGGSLDDGTAYIVMELIEGLPITEFVSTLDTDAKLTLFRKVCEAVQAAHQQLVVHRDIKPSNVLVQADGEPKLLDFGIAKVLQADSQQAKQTMDFAALTPRYAAPEQVNGEHITTATDVYALGVLLYTLVTGRGPYDVREASPATLISTITTADPIPFAEHPESADLPRDLELIIGKAMQKEPGRRYQTAQDLADDLERLQTHRPINARPDSRGYRFNRFIRRNLIAASLTVVAVLSMIGGTVFSVNYAIDAGRQAERSERVTRFLNNLILSPSSYAMSPVRVRKDAPLSELLDEAVTEVEGEFADDPETRVELLSAIALTQYGLGKPEDGAELIERAFLQAKSELPPLSETQLSVRFAYAVIPKDINSMERLEEVRSVVAEYGQIAEALHGPSSQSVALWMILDAQINGTPEERLAKLAAAEEMHLTAGGSAGDLSMGWMWAAKASLLFPSDPQSSASAAENALSIFSHGGVARDFMSADMLTALGLIARSSDEYDHARGYFERAARIFQDVDYSGRQLAFNLGYLGDVTRRTGDTAAAAEHLSAAREVLRRAGITAEDPYYAELTGLEIRVDMDNGDYEMAKKRCEAQLKVLGESPFGERQRAEFIYTLATIHAHLGEEAAAREQALAAFNKFEALFGADHQAVLQRREQFEALLAENQ